MAPLKFSALPSLAETASWEYAAEENPRTSREADLLEECVHQLPPAMQRLLALKYESGHSSEEIARTLDRSLAWVRVTLFRVRQQLRLCIDGKMERTGHAG